jgi:alkylation response protein AidB-like acyl-CoA dehydrogenase
MQLDTPEQEAFRAEARAFLSEHFPSWKRAEQIADGDELTLAQQRSWQRRLFDHGWAAPHWPTDFGGRGLGIVESMIWNQERAEAGAHSFFNIVGLGMAGPTIASRGTPDQRERYLPSLLCGDDVWCQLFSEPNAGSDLGNVQTRADCVDGSWIVNGQKVWSSGAADADRGILIARYDPDLPKQKGLVYLIVDMKAPGVDARPLRQIDGGAHFSEVFFTDVEIPDADRVGEPGEGWSVAMTTLTNERMSLGGGSGDLALPFGDLVALARQATRDHDPRVRQKLARIYSQRKILELLNARVLTALAGGRIPEAEGSIIKLVMANLVSDSAKAAMELIGAEGVLGSDDGPQASFLSSPALHIGGGTDEVQRNAIAERVLGLPREPRPDKEMPFRETRR